jgi:drug/metabolite transporter (DMT)-like permease
MRRLLLLAFIWGWSFLFIKVAGEGLTPSTVAFGRVALGAGVLHLALARQGLRLPTDRRSWRHFAVAALTSAAVPFTLLAWGEQHITSALTAVLNASTPLFTGALAAIFLRERLRPAAIGGLVLGLLGVAVAAGVGADDVTRASLGGGAASVAAGFCYGAAFVYMRRHLLGYPTIVAAAGQLTAAALLLAPVAVVTSAGQGIELTPTRAASVALLGVVGTGVAYVLNYRIIAEVGATRASLVTYAIPVVAVLVGVVVLDEALALRQLVGGLLIVAGIAAVNTARLLPWRGRRRSAATLATGAGPVAVVLLVLLLAGCGADDEGGGAARGGCATAPVREALDTGFLEHVLPGEPEPEYSSDPPTSGPHQPSPDVTGALDDPIARPVQVGLLEAGKVLVQYREPRDAATLAPLASDDVVVAPNPGLDDRVVATAWTWKLTCAGDADVTSLEEFARDHVGDGPEHG